jgi:chemotaxis protein histidine kinase CheA
MTTPGSGAPLGMSDFFALEAGEYLERLDALVQAPEGSVPAPEEFVRLARALRGSALMANQQAIARAASGLEAMARALRENRRAWDPGTRQLTIRAVDDLKIFVRRAGSWTEADTAKAEALAAQLEQSSGRPSAQIRAAEALGLDAGARAFVAREGAAIASALDRAAQALRADPKARDALQHILRALQPLRGLAALNDLPPLPDLLEGIEQAIGGLNAPGGGAPAGAAELFQSAAGAIAKAAREVAERGRPDPDAAEFKAFADRLLQVSEPDADVVPIANLYYGDEGPHVVRRGTPPARPAMLGKLELVSHGEHLRQAADSLERAPSATQRELRAHTLAGTFRALAEAGGGPLADRVAEFAAVARDAVTAGIATREAPRFAAELRKVGDLLTRASTEEEGGLAAQLAELTAALRGPEAATPAPVVPIESLAPSAAPAAARAAPAPADDDETPPETADLIGSWVSYRRLLGAGVGPASLEELMRPSADTGRPAPAPAPVTVRRPSIPAAPPVELPVVDIGTLLYRGASAQRRAQELREEARHASGDRLHALVEEVCDLVALALELPS